MARVDIDLKRRFEDGHTRVELFGRELGTDDRGLFELDRRLRALPLEEEDVQVTINAWAWVPHRHVVRAMDAVKKAGIDDVTFTGAPPTWVGR